MNITRMTEDGAKLSINYSFARSPFGTVIIASTGKGICYLAFADDKAKALRELKKSFPNAHYVKKSDRIQAQALKAFAGKAPGTFALQVKGTDFQIKVWQLLLSIPEGKTSTYGALAKKLRQPRASRAVGTAVGKNPVAYLIPCHRVITASGAFGNYHWGAARKARMLRAEGRQ